MCVPLSGATKKASVCVNGKYLTCHITALTELVRAQIGANPGPNDPHTVCHKSNKQNNNNDKNNNDQNNYIACAPPGLSPQQNPKDAAAQGRMALFDICDL